MPSPPAQNDYEAEREARIMANRARLAHLGLASGPAAASSSSLPRRKKERSATAWSRREREPGAARRRMVATAAPAPPPSRASRRLRGETAPGHPPRPSTPPPLPDDDGADRRAGPRRGVVHTAPPGTSYAAPFALRSIDVTVECLGAIHRGAWAPRYWSSAGCLHHHAYPVGYRATKPCFGTTWECSVEAGEGGPRFRVTDVNNRARSFVGPTPTRPWTDACVAHRTGQRISGPLFFGFSDVVVQRAVSTLYSAAELAAARSGAAAPSAAPDPAERAAAAFAARYDVGDKTAQLLALTTALGGRRHEGPASLEAWARAPGSVVERSQAMLAWLLDGDEIPANTRRWPGWRLRIAPKLVAAVFDLPPPPAAAGGAEGGGGAGPADAAAPAAAPPAAAPAAAAPPPADDAPSSSDGGGGKENAVPARKRARGGGGGAAAPAAAPPKAPRSAGRRASRPPSGLAAYVK